MKTIRYFLFLMCMIFAVSCGKEDDSITVEGMIRFDAVPGCNAYVISTKEHIYKPINLPEKFKQENLPVRAKYVVTMENCECGFWHGVREIKIRKIEKL
jgi:hypothetical protein